MARAGRCATRTRRTEVRLALTPVTFPERMAGTGRMRIIVANLDCEAAFAEAAGVARYHPSHEVAQRISALGTLMSAFGQDGDALWTPAPVHPDRVRGPVRVSLHAGALADLPGPGAEPARIAGWLAWGETREVAARRTAGSDPGGLSGPGGLGGLDWLDWLWSSPPDPEAAWRCNDRRFCVPVQEAIGCRLPGATLVDSLEALRAHLIALDLRPDQNWVLKAPFSASGRLRVRRRGYGLDPGIEARIVRLLARFGTLCFEPWMERVLDIGCLGLVADASTCHVFRPHRLETDRAGVFHAIAVTADASWLAPDHHQAVVHAATEAGRALGRAGYRGPFGIDAFVYRHQGAPGGLALQPMCEINARLSFGFVAHALSRRLGLSRLRLCVGTGAPPASEPAPRPAITPLLLPGESDDTAAWIETSAP
jgi:hypothetical protein